VSAATSRLLSAPNHLVATSHRGLRVLLAIVAWVCAGAAHAQTATTTIGVSARVSGSLSVVTQDDLTFGTISAPYSTRRVAFTDNGPLGRRGRFTIRGDANSELLMELLVPDALSSGRAALPLSEWGMRVHTVDADVGGMDTALAAGSNSVVVRLPAGSTDGLLFVRLRATAVPTGTQDPGAYNATVRVSLSYTGA
jgi:spore coat protein U-like protein